MKEVVIIPSLHPDDRLVPYVQSLLEAGVENILVVDDGSGEKYASIFQTLKDLDGVEVFTHAINLGKGRALKNAFNYCLVHYPDFECVVTADSDGQHTVEDVLKVIQATGESPDKIIFGSRDFDSANVPAKSSYGNKITRNVLRFLYGSRLTDTQTGLRGFSYEILPQMLDIPGERFEYETGMIIDGLQNGIPFLEVPIHTVYENDNKGSHFNPVKDSFKIYKLIFMNFFTFIFSSLSASLIDLGCFQIFVWLFSGLALNVQIWTATILARIISSLYNYFMNRTVVFDSTTSMKSTIVKYYILVVVILALSASFVYIGVSYLAMPKLLCKIIVDGVLFLLSYRVQKDWVFKKK